ncbi:unnamed protein product [Effrenium voratum]|nr:unnamed protein product [Effrenium voratum]
MDEQQTGTTQVDLRYSRSELLHVYAALKVFSSRQQHQVTPNGWLALAAHQKRAAALPCALARAAPREPAAAFLRRLFQGVRRQELHACLVIQRAWRCREERGNDNKLSWPELLCREHVGTVREVPKDERGIGFIRQKAIHALCGYDVLFTQEQLENAKVGKQVRFEVELDSKQRPRVKRSPLDMGACLQKLHTGTICDVDAARGRGFIHHQDIHQLLGKDVLFRFGQLPGAEVGQSVSFRLELDDGKPRVASVQSGASLPKFTTETLLGCSHLGLVAFGTDGRLELRNAQIRRLCGRHAVFSRRELAGRLAARPGACVSFRVRLTPEGLPEVAEVNADAACARQGEPDPDVEVTVQLDSGFGPLGLCFAWGFLPEVQHIAAELRGFWHARGVGVGDRLLGFGLASPRQLAAQLRRRPLDLAFLRCGERTEWPSEG